MLHEDVEAGGHVDGAHQGDDPRGGGGDTADAADDHHRMRAQNVHQNASAKLGGVIQSYDRVSVLRQDEVQPGLVLDDVVNARQIFQRTFHVRHEAREFAGPLFSRI